MACARASATDRSGMSGMTQSAKALPGLNKLCVFKSGIFSLKVLSLIRDRHNERLQGEDS